MKMIKLSFVLFLLFAGIVSASTSPGLLKITLVNQEPDPANPGQYVELRFKIENLGEENIAQLYVKLEPEFPFSLDTPRDAEKYIGNIWPGISEDYGLIVKYRVRVADNAVEGENKIKMAYKYAGSDSWTEMEFSVSVRAIYDQVFVDNIDVQPKIVHAGDIVAVRFDLSNQGDTTVKDLTLSLNLASADVPFVPYGELSEKRIKQLLPGQHETLEFALRADPNADSKLYKIPITLQYTDLQNTKYTKSDVLGLEIGGKPSLMVELEESDVLTPGTKGKVVISIVNNGETDVKFLTLELNKQDNYVIIEGAKQYIGNLDSDDYETAKFVLYLKENTTMLKLPVELSYKDALSNDYRDSYIVNVPVFTKEEAFKYGLIKKSNTSVVFVVVILLVIALLAYRGYRKRKLAKV